MRKKWTQIASNRKFLCENDKEPTVVHWSQSIPVDFAQSPSDLTHTQQQVCSTVDLSILYLSISNQSIIPEYSIVIDHRRAQPLPPSPHTHPTIVWLWINNRLYFSSFPVEPFVFHSPFVSVRGGTGEKPDSLTVTRSKILDCGLALHLTYES